MGNVDITRSERNGVRGTESDNDNMRGTTHSDVNNVRFATSDKRVVRDSQLHSDADIGITGPIGNVINNPKRAMTNVHENPALMPDVQEKPAAKKAMMELEQTVVCRS